MVKKTALTMALALALCAPAMADDAAGVRFVPMTVPDSLTVGGCSSWVDTAGGRQCVALDLAYVDPQLAALCRERLAQAQREARKRSRLWVLRAIVTGDPVGLAYSLAVTAQQGQDLRKQFGCG